MRRKRNTPVLLLFIAVIAFAAIGCSTQKNTAKTRWWHSFNAKYNTYYNGTLAYIDGSLEKENGNKDNFTEIIPLYTVGNKQSREMGKANFERAIEKCEKAIKLHSIKRRPIWDKKRRKTERDIEWLSRKEYNPMLWKAWLLMGRSQFHKGDFDEAASTFSYMSRLYRTQPAIYGRARAWLAKCYVEQDWMYDAEDVIRNMSRDSIHWRAQKEWDYTYADYYIHTGDYAKAIPYLRKVIKHEMRRKQRAREWYLMGQLQAALGNKALATKAYKRVIAQNPPYEVEFNARIALTEVMSTSGQAKKMISRLRRMAASDKNKDYLDQVYYAIGNIYLNQKDTLNAISAYERGNSKATRSGIEKGVLLLKLGDLYWAKEKYNDAQRCYGEAIGLLDKERDDYEQLSERSKVLDELVPYTDAVHLQDSLQVLAKADEKTRNEAIDRVIEALKKKEKEERNRKAELEAEETAARNGGNTGNNNRANTTRKPTGNSSQQSTVWYFYNQMAVNQGKTEFQKKWGKRENVDNWQRNNKTVVSVGSPESGMTEEQLDSIAQAEAREDSLAQSPDSAQNDPHKREYYLAQIPFTDEQRAASDLIIEDGLFNSGVIFKDKLDNLPLSEKALIRLTEGYPEYTGMADAYYHLFLLYSRKGESGTAQGYVDRLKEKFPDSQWTTLLTDPYFRENATIGVHMEDSLYAATYDAFKAGRYGEVEANNRLSTQRFPIGANRDKFMFIGALGKLNSGNADGCVADLKLMLEKYPQSGLAEMAGMIVRGVGEGRRLRGGTFDIGNVWERRSAVLNDSDSIAARQFTADRNADFVFMIAYKPDSVNENKLLFELAKYNFTSYMVRNFDISIEDAGGLHRMVVSGFRNFDEALQYARQLYAQSQVMQIAHNGRGIIISVQNLPLLGQQFSYDDYDAFYSKHFAPLKVSTLRLLIEPEEITTTRRRSNVPTPEEIDRLLDGGTIIDDGEENSPANAGTTIIPDEPAVSRQENGAILIEDERQERQNTAEPANGTIIDIEEEIPVDANGTTVVVEENEPTPKPQPKLDGTVIEAEAPVKHPVSAQTEKSDTTSTANPAKTITAPIKQTTPQNTTPTANASAKTTVKSQTATNAKATNANKSSATTQTTPQTKKKNNSDDEIYFDDDNTSKSKKKKSTNEEEKSELEDEYYDLDGF